jgi:hypothetical protein
MRFYQFISHKVLNRGNPIKNLDCDNSYHWSKISLITGRIGEVHVPASGYNVLHFWPYSHCVLNVSCSARQIDYRQI